MSEATLVVSQHNCPNEPYKYNRHVNMEGKAQASALDEELQAAKEC